MTETTEEGPGLQVQYRRSMKEICGRERNIFSPSYRNNPPCGPPVKSPTEQGLRNHVPVIRSRREKERGDQGIEHLRDFVKQVVTGFGDYFHCGPRDFVVEESSVLRRDDPIIAPRQDKDGAADVPQTVLARE